MVGYPLDTIKVHLQTQDLKNPKYRGVWHCFTTIVKKESAFGLYKGMTSPLAGVAVVNALIFGVYGNVQKTLPGQWHPLVNVFIAGASAGIVQSVICSPMELAKIRMQLQGDGNGPKSKVPERFETKTVPHQRTRLEIRNAPMAVQDHYRNPFDCLRKIHRREGLRGVFRGYGITLTREIPGFGIYFVSYEWLCQVFRGQGSESQLGAFSILMAGGLSGVFSWVGAYPIDVVKTRIQTDGFLGPKQYNSTIDCFVKSYQQEGMAAFTRGLTSTVLRAFPTNAATFLTVSLTFKFLGPVFEGQPTESQKGLGKVVVDLKEKKLEEFHNLQPKPRLSFLQEVILPREDVTNMADIGRLATFAEASFW